MPAPRPCGQRAALQLIDPTSGLPRAFRVQQQKHVSRRNVPKKVRFRRDGFPGKYANQMGVGRKIIDFVVYFAKKTKRSRRNVPKKVRFRRDGRKGEMVDAKETDWQKAGIRRAA
jgi:hypothetical protein